MTAVAISLGVIAWVIILVTCLALARSAAFGDAILRRNRKRDGKRTRRAA